MGPLLLVFSGLLAAVALCSFILAAFDETWRDYVRWLRGGVWY